MGLGTPLKRMDENAFLRERFCSGIIVNASKCAGVAELADAHGSGPCELRLMKVQVLSPAPY